jgi:transposase
MLDNAPAVFEKSCKRDKEQQALLDKPYREIGQLKVERDFLARKSGLM